MSFTIATSLDEALASIAAGARPIAGGSDLVVGARQGKFDLPAELVAIDRIESLATIDVGADETSIGSGVTHSRLMEDGVIVDNFTAIADAAALVGSPSTRNVGTIGGNVMNSSPAMDTGAPLVVLGAEAELTTSSGRRRVGLDELWTGPGQHSAAADELCTALLLPNRPANSGSAYVRLEYRRAMEIAVVGAAAAITLDGDNIDSIRVALTAVAPTIIEVAGLDSLVGRPLDDASLAEIAEAASGQATPISDLRASDAYRRHTIGVMARRAAEAAARRASGETIAVPVNRALGIGAAS
ncbi:MAG: xanthine dehydrogenase family protein subunit M [Acidimicrobiales bacterium]|nr:xanthine dehydrogenase family protein subunit M [Acidimicrobiales bacterium]RZV47316.1 MAG: xanthine dehydrogenase family protein subunit M [Acidimicrobiales bacterium]